MISPAVLVWDASALHHALVADRQDVLGGLAAGAAVTARRNVSTRAVLEELAGNGLNTQLLTWLDVMPLDGIRELRAFAEWQALIGAAEHNLGEATVLAWADVHSAIAIIDDRDACQIGRRHGVQVHGTLWLIAEEVRCGRLPAVTACGLVDTLIDHGAYYPCVRGDFIGWAERRRLLG